MFHRRKLPHFCAIGQPIFLTWRLYGSLPAGRVFPAAITSGEVFAAMDRLLDNAGEGPMHLRAPEIAQLMVETLQFHAESLAHYELHHYVVMPNHIHILITPRVPVSKLTHSLKRYTAREANRILRLTGQRFWQEESYDRIVRNGEEFRRIARYVEMNPVKAGLASTPEEFPWSSAGRIDNPPQVSNLPHKA